MKKIFLFCCMICLALPVFSQSASDKVSNDFFGFNSWNHYEEYISDAKRSPYSVTRTLFDNGDYYIRTDSNSNPNPIWGAVLSMHGTDLPIYRSVGISFFQENPSDRWFTVAESAGCYQTWYYFSKAGNKISLRLEGDDGGEISDYKCTIRKDEIIISYKLVHKHYDFVTDQVTSVSTYRCTETFYNEPKSYLSETLVDVLCLVLYSDEKDGYEAERLADAVSKLKKPELRIARNLVYARHGYIFKSADLAQLFSNFDWYDPTVSNSELIELSPMEKQLVELVQQYEAKK